jgi:hypothetical protein
LKRREPCEFNPTGTWNGNIYDRPTAFNGSLRDGWRNWISGLCCFETNPPLPRLPLKLWRGKRPTFTGKQ